MKNIFLGITLLLFCSSNAQRKVFFPIWTFHQSNITINGISLGMYCDTYDVENTVTNGLRIEAPGVGLLTFAIPTADLEDNDSLYSSDVLNETINGANLSLSGTVGECAVNGLSVGFVGQIIYRMNGLSATFVNNVVKINNGVQLAVLLSSNHRNNGLQVAAVNRSNHTRGLQIGGFNRSKDLRGVQIGLWNENAKRSLPFINWQFKKVS